MSVQTVVSATGAVDVLRARLDAIPHPTAGVLRLVQFAHSSPQVETLRRQIAEGLVLLLESNGYTITADTAENDAF